MKYEDRKIVFDDLKDTGWGKGDIFFKFFFKNWDENAKKGKLIKGDKCFITVQNTIGSKGGSNPITSEDGYLRYTFPDLEESSNGIDSGDIGDGYITSVDTSILLLLYEIIASDPRGHDAGTLKIIKKIITNETTEEETIFGEKSFYIDLDNIEEDWGKEINDIVKVAKEKEKYNDHNIINYQFTDNGVAYNVIITKILNKYQTWRADADLDPIESDEVFSPITYYDVRLVSKYTAWLGAATIVDNINQDDERNSKLWKAFLDDIKKGKYKIIEETTDVPAFLIFFLNNSNELKKIDWDIYDLIDATFFKNYGISEFKDTALGKEIENGKIALDYEKWKEYYEGGISFQRSESIDFLKLIKKFLHLCELKSINKPDTYTLDGDNIEGWEKYIEREFKMSIEELCELPEPEVE